MVLKKLYTIKLDNGFIIDELECFLTYTVTNLVVKCII